MPLSKQILQQSIEIAFKSAAAKTGEGDSPEASAKDIATAIADAVDLYVRAAVVNVTVVGSSPSGPVTGTGVGTLS